MRQGVRRAVRLGLCNIINTVGHFHSLCFCSLSFSLSCSSVSAPAASAAISATASVTSTASAATFCTPSASDSASSSAAASANLISFEIYDFELFGQVSLAAVCLSVSLSVRLSALSGLARCS